MVHLHPLQRPWGGQAPLPLGTAQGPSTSAPSYVGRSRTPFRDRHRAGMGSKSGASTATPRRGPGHGPGRQDRRFCNRAAGPSILPPQGLSDFQILWFWVASSRLSFRGCLVSSRLLAHRPSSGQASLGSCLPGHLRRSFFNGWRRRRLTAAAVLILSPAAPIWKACRQT